MEKKLNELKDLLAKAEKAYAISNDDSLDEAAQDAAYTEGWNYKDRAAAILVDLIKVDRKTAWSMIRGKQSEIIALLSRMAA